MVSDVPISLLLSGGIDSSAIATEAVKRGGNIKNAYTISSSLDNKYDKQDDDLKYAKLVAKKLGIDLKVIQAKQDFVSTLSKLPHFLEDGLADPAAINTYLIAKGAKEDGVKVMLSGQGADEYLGGYRRYLAEKVFRKMPPQILNLTSSIDKFLPGVLPGKFNASFRRFKKIISLSESTGTERLLDLYLWSSEEEINNLFINPLDFIVGRDHQKLFKDYKDQDILSSMMLVDQRFDLRSLNLAYTDKMSMMMGIEVRVPFLDFELVRFMNSLPLNMKIHGTTSKYILKKAMRGSLPKKIINRQKTGFSLPIRSWFKSDNELTLYYFDQRRISQQGIFDANHLKKIIDEQHLGHKDHSYILFAMLALQIWLDNNLNKLTFAA